MAEETEMEECLREENESLRAELAGVYARALRGTSPREEGRLTNHPKSLIRNTEKFKMPTETKPSNKE